ncbi:MAG TPA: hypothetical protein VG325_13490 [Solirubrobacteraceae bacterium]|nr:hypothetical protein [Solirubrobacteraceae bacterium]
MLTCSALAADGTELDGFEFDGERTVRYRGATPVRAGIRLALELPRDGDPGWLVPGVFYGENRPRECTRLYPRFTSGRVDVDAMESDAWSFRADRCATPAVFARGGGLSTTELSPVGQPGVGFADRDGRRFIWLDFPYREEPLRYDGSEVPALPDVRSHEFSPGDAVALPVSVHDGDWRAALRPEASVAPAAWVPVDSAAALAAFGLYRWHYRPDPGRLVETVSFDGARVRDHMHVSWVSGVPYAYALLRHGRRVGNDAYVAAAEAVLDHVAGALAPSGTFWPQWTREEGWTTGWHPDPHRAHARTLADAALFMLRAGERWRQAALSNVAVALRTQRADGALPAAHDLRTGDALSWQGTAGMAWIPALVAAGHDAAAGRAGAYYRRFEHWCGAPEDVDLAPTSEDGYAAVMAFVALEDWETARRAADWTLTFRYSYDVAFAAETTLGRYRFRTRGADQASPANQHLHAFGLICLPEMLALGEPYRSAALQHLECFRQFIARHDGDFGARRGMAAERYLQTDCFGAKGTLDPLSHAWSLGVLLYACEVLL